MTGLKCTGAGDFGGTCEPCVSSFGGPCGGNGADACVCIVTLHCSSDGGTAGTCQP
jgi:hypothetical protein